MASFSLARPMLRSPILRMAARRFESTAAEAASAAAKETASKASTTAAETASKASATASKASATAAETASKASATAAETASKASAAAKETAAKASAAAKETAAKASAAAKQTATKAQEGLSRVASAAGPALAGAARAAGRVGGPVGKAAGFVERQSPLLVYYGKVGLELAKLVAQGQKMSIPSTATFQSFYQNLWTSVQNRTILKSPQSLIQQARNISTAQVATFGVLAAECLGFFTVGEMIGRFKLVGYHGEVASHH
ncbi:mitochondrial ATP synthase g subunit-domain-containing protein [Stachybotrys elegans]|uniref:Mitochondrial ATP synthase g subunit-domain-containing protein n=1 Tax=Stachybotrys elegans TaxID=80388 RepID=A0A8K0SR06_9HYPO|nr:mitochondrial ATP synthase g subunit-domain-containing protein [Stachybotrys elegans]